MNNRFLFALLVSIALIPLASGVEQPASGKFDVIIKGGTVYDGTGEKPRVIDVAIRGDRIAGLGTFSADHARTVIDAKGLAAKIAPVRIGGRLSQARPEFWEAT